MNRREMYGLLAVLAVVVAGVAIGTVAGRREGSTFRIVRGQAGAPAVQSAPARTPDTSAADSTARSGAFRSDGRLDLNRATAGDLQSLDRVGPARARAIVAYREKAGRFRSIEELQNVPGIGEKTRQTLEPQLYVEAGPAEPAVTPAGATAVPEHSSSGVGLATAATTATALEPVGIAAAPTSAPLAAVVAPPPASTPTPGPAASPTPGAVAAVATVAPPAPAVSPAAARAVVNINTASETELLALWNVGPVKARAIVQWRQAHGPFRRAEDLERVSGIGPETVRRNLPMIAVGP